MYCNNVNFLKIEADFPCVGTESGEWHKHFLKEGKKKILGEGLPIFYRQQGSWRRVSKKDACHRARILSSQQKGCTGWTDEQNKY